MSSSNSSNKLSNNNNDFFDELKIGIQELSKIMHEHKLKDNIEIELRIGQIQHDGFKPGLGTVEFYNKIKNTLDTCQDWIKVVNSKTEELCSNGMRRTISVNDKKIIKHQCMKKERILVKDLTYTGTPYNIRISVCKEIDVNNKIKIGIIRKKNRLSYYYKDYIIDLTIVEQIENGVSTINYEIEVEFINTKNEVSDMYRSHSGLLLMRDMINMCEEIEKDSILEFPDEE